MIEQTTRLSKSSHDLLKQFIGQLDLSEHEISRCLRCLESGEFTVSELHSLQQFCLDIGVMDIRTGSPQLVMASRVGIIACAIQKKMREVVTDSYPLDSASLSRV